jgi:trimeric autotransporter adhesin
MLTKLRIAPARFLPFAALACLVALGCFDTVQAQDLTVSASTLAFSTSPGVNPVNAQTVSIGSTGASFSFTISADASWISASTGLVPGNGTTGQTLTVQVTSSSLASGSYTGHITLTPDNGSPAVTITVNLDISGSGNTTYTLTPSLSNLYFAYELGQNVPAAQTIQISSTGIALPISITSSVTNSPNCPSGWLTFTASGTTTPVMITAAVVTTGLGAGTCGGKITVTSNTSGNGTTTTVIDVLVYISANALLNIAIPVGLTNVTLLQGGDPVKFNIGLTSSDPNVALGFTATSINAPWLAPPTPSTGATPASLYVQFTPGLVLAAGTYTSQISIFSSTIYGNPLVIPITFTLLPNNAVTISNSTAQTDCTIANTVTCSFSELQNGSLPASLTLNLTGTSSSSYTTSVTPGSVGGDWLQVSPAMGTIAPSAPGTVTLSVAPNTPQGSYTSVVTITFVPATIPPISIFVTLNVAAPAPALVASPPTVSFTYQSGGAVPAAQNLAIADAANPASGSISYFLASVSDTWLAVSPNSGTTPGLVSVSVSPQSLQPGMYNGSFTLSATGGLTLTVAVSLAVAANQTPEPFIIANNSSNIGGQISPGEIIFIKGSNLGPVTGVVGASTSLGGVTVTFNGTLATILYASASQLDVIVPYEVIPQQTATMVVSYANASSSGIQLTVAAAALGISTDNQAGTGQAAAQNQDYTLNSPANPALPGSYVSIYGTGGGQTNPASTDGEISPSAVLPLVLQPYVTATIGGVAATVAFVGAAPGEITGVVQIDLQVPAGVSGPALPVVITINGSTVIQSQTGVTIAVQ